MREAFMKQMCPGLDIKNTSQNGKTFKQYILSR